MIVGETEAALSASELPARRRLYRRGHPAADGAGGNGPAALCLYRTTSGRRDRTACRRGPPARDKGIDAWPRSSSPEPARTWARPTSPPYAEGIRHLRQMGRKRRCVEEPVVVSGFDPALPATRRSRASLLKALGFGNAARHRADLAYGVYRLRCRPTSLRQTRRARPSATSTALSPLRTAIDQCRDITADPRRPRD